VNALQTPLRRLYSVLTLPSRAVVGEIASGVVSFAAVAGLGGDNGGYFPTTWGWAAVALCGIAAALLALAGVPRLRPIEKLFLIVVLALVVCTFFSSFWSISVTRSMLEGERSLVYLGSAAVAVLVSRRAGGRAVVIGSWAGITAVSSYALVTRLFPVQFGVFDPLSGNRLSTPVGYSNGLGIFAALGLLLAVGLAARSGAIVKMAASASAVVLLLALYFTFARGAWAALLFGVAAAVAVDRRRLQLATTTLAFAVCPALAVWYASRSDALTHIDVTSSAAQHDGHSVAVVAVFLMTFAALGALLLDSLGLEHRLRVGPRLRYAVVGALAVVVVVSVAFALVRYGTPSQIARDAWSSFTTPSNEVAPNEDLNARLASLAGSGRIDHWRVAGHEIAAHPWLGSGAGTYGEYWFQHRPVPLIVHDAHNLYLETLAELGPIGLALVVLLLSTLLAATARAGTPLAACAFGACVAYTLHATVDWDWELPCILVAIMFPALAVLGDPSSRIPGVWLRALLVGVTAATGAFALFTLIGNIDLSRSISLSDATKWRQAASAARSARDYAPWSAEPLRALAVAQGGLDQIDAARANLRAAVDMEPRDWSLWYQLSEVSLGPARHHAFAEARRLNPRRTSGEALSGDLRLVAIP
jgi:O-antigen ligase/polysaccharide polymerase Wzy-like membrane protein